MLLARENVDSPLAAMVVATEHNALLASGCQPPSVDNGTGSRLNRVPAACSMPGYLETLAVHAAFNRFNGFSDSSRILAWLRGVMNRGCHRVCCGWTDMDGGRA